MIIIRLPLPLVVRIKTEENAMDVAVVWETELIQFIAAVAILHQEDLKKGINSSYCSYHPGAIHPILHIVMVQNSYSVAKKLIDSAPPRSSDDLCILFCLYPFSIVINYSNCSLLQWLIFLGVYYGGREDSSEGEIQVWLKFKYRLPAIFAFH